MARHYWLMKSEPGVYSLDDLKRDKKTSWDGVRNYRARNYLRDQIKLDDGVLFYHSRVDPMAVVGIAKVVKEAHADPSQFDPHSKYFDEKSTPDKPRWYVVDIAYEHHFKNPVTLKSLHDVPGLEAMVLLNNSRLSVQPVTAEEWKIIHRLGAKRMP
ncbi:MAG: EVE domain-containing protein [Myxococcota bacterium]